MGMAADLVRRFMPDADRRTLTVASIWLIGQCSVFLRNRDRLAEPPIGLESRRCHGRMAGAGDQPLDRGRAGRGSAPAAPESSTGSGLSKKPGMPQKFLFPGQRPPRTDV